MVRERGRKEGGREGAEAFDVDYAPLDARGAASGSRLAR